MHRDVALFKSLISKNQLESHVIIWLWVWNELKTTSLLVCHSFRSNDQVVSFVYKSISFYWHIFIYYWFIYNDTMAHYNGQLSPNEKDRPPCREQPQQWGGCWAVGGEGQGQLRLETHGALVFFFVRYVFFNRLFPFFTAIWWFNGTSHAFLYNQSCLYLEKIFNTVSHRHGSSSQEATSSTKHNQ